MLTSVGPLTDRQPIASHRQKRMSLVWNPEEQLTAWETHEHDEDKVMHIRKRPKKSAENQERYPVPNRKPLYESCSRNYLVSSQNKRRKLQKSNKAIIRVPLKNTLYINKELDQSREMTARSQLQTMRLVDLQHGRIPFSEFLKNLNEEMRPRRMSTHSRQKIV